MYLLLSLFTVHPDIIGFEKMDSGLKENFPDRVSPIKAHVDGLRGLGAETGPLNPHVNAVTSDVVRVSLLHWVCLSYHIRLFLIDCLVSKRNINIRPTLDVFDGCGFIGVWL